MPSLLDYATQGSSLSAASERRLISLENEMAKVTQTLDRRMDEMEKVSCKLMFDKFESAFFFLSFFPSFLLSFLPSFLLSCLSPVLLYCLLLSIFPSFLSFLWCIMV